MARKQKDKALGLVEEAIRSVIDEYLQDLREDMTQVDGPLVEPLIAAIESRIGAAQGGKPDLDAVRFAAGDAVREWSASEEAKRFVEDAVKGPIGALEQRLSAMIRESASAASSQGSGVELDARLTALIEDKVSLEMDATGDELIRRMESSTDQKLKSMDFATRKDLEAIPAGQGLSAGGAGIEEKVKSVVEEVTGSVLAEEAKELIVRIKQDLKGMLEEKFIDFAESPDLARVTGRQVTEALSQEGLTADDVTRQVEETIKVAISGAFNSTLFSNAVEAVLAEKGGGGGGGDPAQIRDIAREEGRKVTEEILMREAQGLVKQVKVEVGKVQKQIDKLAQQGGGAAAPDIGKLKTEIETSITGNIEKFFESPDFRGLIETVVESKAREFTAGAKAGGGPAGGLPSPAQLQSLVDAAVSAKMKDSGGGGGGGGGLGADKVKAIVEETLAASMAAHVGKFLDEKLPPPEYFESLATMNQVREEIEKKVSSSGSGTIRPAGAGGMLAGNPGESAVFTNLITRILGSDDLKEMIDDKFKVINNYVKNELVPKVVKKILDDEKGR